MAYGDERSELGFKVVLLTVAAIAILSVALSGCIVPLDGEGRFGIGYKSETTVFVYHTVDGDKMGKTARSELKLHPALMSLIGDEQDETTAKTGTAD